jgi:tetratricopeptide (TPR) repeat protein
MNCVNTLKKVFLTAGIILLLPIVLSASVFAERRQIEGYGSYFLMFSEIEDEALAKERARYEALQNASEKAAVFVDSSSDMVYGRLTRSEIRSYAPSVLRVQGLPQYARTSQGNGALFSCRLVAMVDTSDFKNISYESLQKIRRQEGERELLIREMDELKYKYAHAYSDAERQNIRFRMKQLIDQFMRNRTSHTTTTYDTAMAKLAYNDAVDCGNNKDYSNAIALYQKAISYDPRFYSAYNNLGIIYEDVLLDYDKARECFETAVQINPAYDYAYCNLGILYKEAYKDYEKAMEYYNKVLRLNSKFPNIYNYIAGVYLATGKYADAMEAVQKELSVNKPTPFTYRTLGEIYLERGEYNKAMEAVEKSLTLRKDYAAGHLIRGLIYEKMGDKFKAIQDIRKAKELDPYDQRIKEHYDRLK